VHKLNYAVAITQKAPKINRDVTSNKHLIMHESIGLAVKSILSKNITDDN
jgi:hypothetical protein